MKPNEQEISKLYNMLLQDDWLEMDHPLNVGTDIIGFMRKRWEDFRFDFMLYPDGMCTLIYGKDVWVGNYGERKGKFETYYQHTFQMDDNASADLMKLRIYRNMFEQFRKYQVQVIKDMTKQLHDYEFFFIFNSKKGE